MKRRLDPEITQLSRAMLEVIETLLRLEPARPAEVPAARDRFDQLIAMAELWHRFNSWQQRALEIRAIECAARLLVLALPFWAALGAWKAWRQSQPIDCIPRLEGGQIVFRPVN